MINSRRLEIYCDTIDLGSITLAAAKHYVTQPVVSRMIAGLEAHFGSRLLDRRGRRVVPTEQGWVVYRLGMDLIRAERDAGQLIRDLNRGHAGLVSVAVTDSIGSYVMADLWADFSLRFPHANLALRIHDSETVLAMVANGSVDVGIAITDTFPSGLAAEKLGEWCNVLVASRMHRLAGHDRVTAADLEHERFLCAVGARHVSMTTDRLRLAGVNGPVRLTQFGNTEAIKRAVKRRVGLAFLSRIAVRDDLETGELFELSLEGLPVQSPVFLVHPAASPGRPLQQAFCDYLREHGEGIGV